MMARLSFLLGTLEIIFPETVLVKTASTRLAILKPSPSCEVPSLACPFESRYCENMLETCPSQGLGVGYAYNGSLSAVNQDGDSI